tara:strand:- start:2497 stop:2679 length:183 start_codon:yes stop_codon:yes gene_type:complete
MGSMNNPLNKGLGNISSDYIDKVNFLEDSWRIFRSDRIDINSRFSKVITSFFESTNYIDE